MRGDRPRCGQHPAKKSLSTPHARGSTSPYSRLLPWQPVYPACAGIDPVAPPSLRGRPSLSRMRGDRPFSPNTSIARARSTPHARGSTLLEKTFQIASWVYPACAGIDLG